MAARPEINTIVVDEFSQAAKTSYVIAKKAQEIRFDGERIREKAILR